MLRRFLLGLLLAAAACLPGPTAARDAAPATPVAARPAALPLLDTAVPGLGATGRAALDRALLANLPRAFAIGPGGAFGWRSGGASTEDAAQAALDGCRQHAPGRAECVLWLRDLEVVGPGRAFAAPRPPEGLAFGDARRVTTPDPRYIWWGPAAARGVLVWAHGRNADGSDSRGNQPQAWIRHFNNAGFDIWRFDRDPATDFTRPAAAWLRADLSELRRRGYRQVIAAGQSRGGWNALQALDTPGLAEAVIAIAPAALATQDPEGQARQLAALREVVAAATAARARVAVANFTGDPFNGLPDERAAALRALDGRVAALLLIDRPEGIAGHAGGHARAFADRFGPCLYRFATAPEPPRAC